MTGTVHLVGAGPGDPGLLTVRAAELLARAGAVVHDHDAHPAVLAHAEGAELVPAGMGGADEVAARLAELAARHGTVVRLARGDAFALGRGGDEALRLAEAGVRFEVVPGVPVETAAPAYAGIPVADGGASPVTILPAREGGEAPTVVVSLGEDGMDDAIRRVLAAGLAPSTRAAVVARGTGARQRTVEGTVGGIADAVRAAGIGGPALLVAGDAVRRRGALGWWERRPLAGRRIVVTRARAQAGDFAAALEEMGAEVVPFPTIRIAPVPDPGPLRDAVARAASFHWIVFTSVNGVEAFWAALDEAGRDTRALGGVRVAAIGPATAGALARRGIRADVVPGEYVAEAALEALAAADDLAGRRILLPRADLARAVLPERLRMAGAEVEEVDAYTTVPDGAGADRVRQMLADGEVDVVTFTASSTVRNFVRLLGAEVGTAAVACIGPITAATARELGMRVDVEAEEYTIPGLMAALVAFAGHGPDGSRV